MGLTANFSSKSVVPALVTQNTSGVNPSKWSFSLDKRLSGIRTGKNPFSCPDSFNFLSRESFIISQILYPYGLSTINPLTGE